MYIGLIIAREDEVFNKFYLVLCPAIRLAQRVTIVKQELGCCGGVEPVRPTMSVTIGAVSAREELVPVLFWLDLVARCNLSLLVDAFEVPDGWYLAILGRLCGHPHLEMFDAIGCTADVEIDFEIRQVIMNVGNRLWRYLLRTNLFILSWSGYSRYPCLSC